MKEHLLLPLRYIFIFLACMVIFSGIVVLGDMSASMDAFLAAWKIPVSAFVDIVSKTVLPSWITSFLYFSFRIVNYEKWHYSRLLILGIMSFACMTGCLLLWQHFPVKSEAASVKSEISIMSSKGILADDGNFIFKTDSGSGIENWIFHASRIGSKFVVLDKGSPLEAGTTYLIPEEAADIGFPDRFVSDANVPFLLDIFTRSFTQLRSVLGGIGSFLMVLMTAGVFSIYFSSLWLVVRLTRWPLFNFMLVVLIVSASFQALIYLFSREFMGQLGFIPVELLPYTPLFIILAVSLLMFALNALRPSVKEWRQGLIA